MYKEKKILINYLSYILLGLFICLVGISNVFADGYTDIGYVDSTTVFMVQSDMSPGAPISLNLNQVYSLGGVREIDIVLGYNFVANTNYQIETHFAYQSLDKANKYTVTGLNGELCTVSYDNSILYGNYPRWAFQCPHATNSVTVSIYNDTVLPGNIRDTLWNGTTDFAWNNAILRIGSFDLTGSSTDNNNQNTQNIINNNNQNTQNIIDNNNQNTQNIINNNNSNTNIINNTINDNLKICRDSNNLFNVAQATSKNYSASLSLENTNYYIYHPNSDNITITATGVHYMEPIQLSAGTYNFNFKANSTGANFKRMRYQIRYGPKGSPNNLTDIATEVITWDSSLEIFGRSFTFTLSSTTYLWISITNDVPGGTLTIYDYMLSRGSKRLDYEKYGEPFCVNKIDNVTDSVNNLGDKIDSTNDKIDSTNQKLDDLQDSIMDNSNPDVPSVDTMVGWLPPGPVDSILNLPLTFLNTLNTNLGKTCSPVSIPLPFVNQNFNLPCFSEYMSTYLPSFNTLWNLIGGIVCVYILYNYLLSLYVWVDKTLTLRENNLPGYYDDNWGGGA